MKRWSRVLLLALLGAVLFDLLLLLAWQAALDVQTPFSAEYKQSILWLAIALSFYLIAEPVRIRRLQIRGWIRYPPIWFSVVLGLLLTGAREKWAPYIGIRLCAVSRDWPHSFPLGWCAAVLACGAVFFRYLQSRDRSEPPIASGAASKDEVSLTSVQTWIVSGERPRRADEPDFFGHRTLAKRIARRVGQEGSPVALLGALGSGKSSILNAVRAELDGMATRVVVARIDVWTVPDPEDVPRLALQEIINALDELVDTLELRGLPRSYKRLAAAEPSGWLARTVGGDSSADSLEALTRLEPILDAVPVRVVLLVEDVERAGPDFDTRHLERFLWALRRLDGCAFVFAVDPNLGVDVSKLCDTIERVPRVSVDQVTPIFLSAYERWISEYSDIDPYIGRQEHDNLNLRTSRPGQLLGQRRELDEQTAQEALLSLLRTPRALKHVIRRVDEAWTNLHGEAELDDIVIVSALRYGTPDAFAFLLANIDLAREAPDRSLPDSISVKDEWQKVVKSLPNGPAVQRLVDLLGIGQLCGNTPDAESLSPQGVHIEDPVDYFSRIVAEELGPEELRDQEVLRHIEQWKTGRVEPLVIRLVPERGVDEHYARVWQRFAGQPDAEQMIKLTDLVVDRLLSIHGSSASGSHPALSVLWFECERSIPKDQYSDWLTSLINRSIPQSLTLASEILSYGTNQASVLDENAKETLRHSVAEAVRSILKSPQDLVRALSKNHPYAIRVLVTETMAAKGVIEQWRDFLSRQVLLGARRHPDIVLPQLATLAVDVQSAPKFLSPGPPELVHEYSVDRERMKTLFQGRLDEALNLIAEYDGEDTLIREVQHLIRAWIDERGP